MQSQKILPILLAGTLVLMAVFPSSSAAARKKAEPLTKIETPSVSREVTRPQGTSRAIRPQNSTTREVGRGSLSERIEAILKEAREQEAAESPVKVAPTRSKYDDAILGTPLATQAQCVKYLLDTNPNPQISVSPEQLVSLYYEEGAKEGIRPDVAFAQALKETGFFRYGGTVTPDQNNYCGLGTTSSIVKGAYFATAELGVRAHIQHLLAYAATRAPQTPIVDPRYALVRGTYGTKTLGAWEDLNGRWAVPGNSYGQSILSMFRAMLRE